MHNSKTIEALKHLDAAEMRRFTELICSPYFNKHDKLIQLADILHSEHPTYTGDIWEQHRLYEILYPGERYKSQRINDLFTYLYRLLEEFIAQEQYKNDFKKQADLLSGLRGRKMDKLFESTIKKQPKRRQNYAFETTEDRLYSDYLREAESDLYFVAQDSRTHDKSIERKSQALDHFYLTAKLRQACEMKNRENIVQQRYQTNLLNEILDIINRQPEIEAAVPALAIYHKILLTLTESDKEEHYYQLIALLEEHHTGIPMSELRSMYDYAQNYCIKKINSGNRQFLEEIFKLYQALLEHAVIFVNEELSQWDYKNIVTVGTRLKEYAWTEQFLHRYKERLPEADRENAYNYNVANFYYSRGMYDGALELLRDVQFTDVYYGLGARSLLLKVYYEAEEYDPLYSLFDSFKIYLKRNKLVSEYQYRAHMGLVRFTKKLTDLRLRMVSSGKDILLRDLDKLQRQVAASGELSNASWLNTEMEKIQLKLNRGIKENV